MKKLPNSEESEKALIGCMLIDNMIINHIRLKEEDFYNNLYFRLFNSIRAIFELKGTVDILNLKEFLEKKGVLEKLGGMRFIVELIEDTPLSSHWKIYFNLIKESSNRRKIISIGRKIENIGFESDEESEKILMKVKSISENVFEIEDKKGFDNYALTDKFLELQERFKKYKGLGYDSCYKQIDKYTGGIIPGTVQTIVAYSNVGKSSFAYSYIPDLLKKGKKVLFLSNEVMADILYSNIIRSYYGKTLNDIMKDDFYLFYDGGHFDNLRIIDEIFDLEEIKIVVESSSADVIFIDFIQNINGGMRTEYENMSRVAIELQRLAIKTGKTIFSVSQANNESRFSSGDKLQPKGSGAIFASSDIILGLTSSKQEMKLNILKNKYGKKDISFLVDPDFSRVNFKITSEVFDEITE